MGTCSSSGGPCQCHDDSDCDGLMWNWEQAPICLKNDLYSKVHIADEDRWEDQLEENAGFCFPAIDAWTREHCSQKGRCTCVRDEDCEMHLIHTCSQGECIPLSTVV